MNTQEISQYKKLLEIEKQQLESELSTVGRKNPSNNADWEPTPEKLDTDPADESEVADAIESYESNSAILKHLETRLLEVNAALDKITAGTYGICEISGEPIETERLDANPAARTCIGHMNDNL